MVRLLSRVLGFLSLTMASGNGRKSHLPLCYCERTRSARMRWIVPALLFAFSVYCYLSIRNIRWYEWPYKFSDDFTNSPCARPEKFRRSLVAAASALDAAMAELNVDYFLAYGSLFGALRYGGPVPWDADVDIGILADSLSRHSSATIERVFAKRNFSVAYQGWGGLYKFRRGDVFIDGMLFRDYYGTGWMYRVGIESWVLFLNYRWHHNFPARLVKTPPTLPRMKFGSTRLPVPREGIELQRYHFRDDWNVEKYPPSCRGVDLDKYRALDH